MAITLSLAPRLRPEASEEVIGHGYACDYVCEFRCFKDGRPANQRYEVSPAASPQDKLGFLPVVAEQDQITSRLKLR